MSPSVKAVARVSQALAGYISSLSENENAATRALILLGVAELGIDPTLVDDDLRLTMAAPLPPELYARLQAIRDRVDHHPPARVRLEAATRHDGLSTSLYERSAEPPAPAPPAEPGVTPVRKPGLYTIEPGRSGAAPPSAGHADAPYLPVSQVHAALPDHNGQGDDDGIITSPASCVWSMQSEHAAGYEEAFDPFIGIGFDFDAPAG